MAGALAAAAPADCAPDPPLHYVCGPVKPEDVLAIPGTPWLVVSGFSPGAGLKLVDGRSGSFRFWFDGVSAPDPARFPTCPGPLDPALFNARGLALRKTGANTWRLLAVNHGGREAVEVFDIATRGSAEPGLTWRGCLPLPAGQVGNSVASFADGTVLVTVLTRPGTTIADFVEGRNTGAVWSWSPGAAGFVALPGTELPGNNGLEVDPDGRRFYVVAFGWHAVLVYDRRDTTRPLARIEAPGFMPDNIHWSGGQLLLTGMRLDEPACGGFRKVVDGVADPMLCHRGWAVGALDARRKAVRIVAQGAPAAGFNGHSAAAISGGRLWLGSFQASRLAWLPLPKALHKEASR
ncbi:MAG: hypothetical protein ACKOPM_16805 [Novosphingobium sp.]